MPTSDYLFVKQMHADRTARLQGTTQLRMPRLPRLMLRARRQQRQLVTSLPAGC